MLLPLLVLCCLLHTAVSQYSVNPQPYPLQDGTPANAAVLPTTCLPLAASDSLVLQYGSSFVGQCAWSFCLQLFTTPFPSQDPTAQAYATCGFIFTATSAQQLPVSYPLLDPARLSNLNAYTVTGMVGLRSHQYFDQGQSCGSALPVYNISGLVAGNGNVVDGSNDNLLLTQFPYVTASGIAYQLNASILSIGQSDFDGSPSCANQVVFRANPVPGLVGNALVDLLSPTSSAVWEPAYGQTNYAAFNISAWSPGSSAAVPSCPLYAAPVNVSSTAFSFLLQSPLLQVPTVNWSVCWTGQLTVTPAPRRQANVTAVLLVLAATGSRQYIDAYGGLSATTITGLLLPPLVNETAMQGIQYSPIWVDNALVLNPQTGQLQPSINGLGFVFFNGSTAAQAGSFLLAGQPVSFLSSITVYSQPAAPAVVEAQLALPVTASGSSTFSLLSSPPSCPAVRPLSAMLPGTNLADPSGFTTLGLQYFAQQPYSTANGVQAFTICLAAILTVELFTAQQSGVFTISNVTGVRTYTTQQGAVYSSSIVAAAPGSLFGYPAALQNSLTIPNEGGATEPGLSLLLSSPVYAGGGVFTAPQLSLYLNQVYGPSYPFEALPGAGYLPSVPLNSLVAETLSSVFLSGSSSFIPSTVCPATGSPLPLLAGASSPSSLTSTSVFFAYMLISSSFSGSSWLVCGSGSLTVASSAGSYFNPNSVLANSSVFPVLSASGSRAFVNLSTRSVTVNNVVGVASPSSVLPSRVDNVLSAISPGLPPNGVALALDSTPMYSSGSFGPSVVVLNVSDSPLLSTYNGFYDLFVYQEANSPDLPVSQTVYFTLESGAAPVTTAQQDCSALVSNLQQTSQTVLQVPFSYSVVVLQDSTYGTWSVCASGTLSILATPVYLSASMPQAYVVVGAAGSRTLIDATGASYPAVITGIAAAAGGDSNLLLINQTTVGNVFSTGLVLTLDRPVPVVDQWDQAAVGSTLTVTTGINDGGLLVAESVGDFSGVVYANYSAASSILAGASLPGCPVQAAAPAVPVQLDFSLVQNSTDPTQLTSICLSGTLTVDSNPVQAVSFAANPPAALGSAYYRVLNVTGTRVWTDSFGQSVVQSIAGISPAGAVSPLAFPSAHPQSNDNLLQIPGSLSSSSAVLIGSFDQLGLALQLSSPAWYPNGPQTQSGVGNTVLLSSLPYVDAYVDDYLIQTLTYWPYPATAPLLLLTSLGQQSNSSQLPLFSCPVSSNPRIPPLDSSLTYYFYYNASYDSYERECMSGSMRLGNAPLPFTPSPGSYSYAVVSISGSRFLYNTQNQVTSLAGITGLASTPNADQRVSLTQPSLDQSGLGLQFNTSLLEPFNPNDPIISFSQNASSSYSQTRLYWDPQNGIQEVNAFDFVPAGGSFLVSATAASVPTCSASSVAQQAPVTAFAWLYYTIVGYTFLSDSPFSFCATMLVEYTPGSTQQGNCVDTGGSFTGFSVVSIVAGNRSIAGGLGGNSGSSGWTTQEVLGLAAPSLISLQYPYLDESGLTFTTSCPGCNPAAGSPITVQVPGCNLNQGVEESTSGILTTGSTGIPWSRHILSSTVVVVPYELQGGSPYISGTNLTCPTGSLQSQSSFTSSPLPAAGPPAPGLPGSAVYTFAYSLQGAALSSASLSPNLYGNWSVQVQGQLTVNYSTEASDGGLQLLSVSGTRTLVDAVGRVTVQSIVGLSASVPAPELYSVSGGPLQNQGWALLLNGSVATPAGPAYGNVLYLQPSSQPSAANAVNTSQLGLVSLGYSSLVEQTVQQGGLLAAGPDSALVMQLAVTPANTANSSALLALLPSVAQLAASNAAAAAAANVQLAPGLLSFSFRYALTPAGLLSGNSSFWQVCSTGSLSLNGSARQWAQGAWRYPVVAATGVRSFVQYSATYPSLLQQLAAGAAFTAPASVSSSGIASVVSSAGWSDNLLQVAVVGALPDASGLTFAMTAAPVYYGSVGTASVAGAPTLTLIGSSGSPLLPSALSSPFVAPPLSEYAGPPSQGVMALAASAAALPALCSAPGSAGQLSLSSYSLLLVFSFNVTAGAAQASSSLANVCGVVLLTVGNLSLQTGYGTGLPVLSATGFRYAQTSSGSIAAVAVQSLSSSAGYVYPAQLQTSAAVPLLDPLGLTFTLQGNDSSGASSSTVYQTAQGGYSEAQLAPLTVSSAYVATLPGSTAPSSALCSPPTAPVQSSSSSSTATPPSPPSSSAASVSSSPSAQTGSATASAASSSPASSSPSSASAAPVSVSSSVQSSSVQQSSSSVPATAPSSSATSAAATSPSSSAASAALTSPSASSASSSAPPPPAPSSSFAVLSSSAPSSSVLSSSAAAPSSSSSSSSAAAPSSQPIAGFVTSSSSGSQPSALSSSSSAAGGGGGGGSGLSHGAIAGIVIGSVVGGLLLLLLCLLCCLPVLRGKRDDVKSEPVVVRKPANGFESSQTGNGAVAISEPEFGPDLSQVQREREAQSELELQPV